MTGETSRAKHALRTALGGEKFELLVGFLTFIRSAHYWTLMHPELALEEDVQELLRGHEELARMLLEDPEAGHCEMGARLFNELQALRDLNKRQELEKAKRALEESGRQSKSCLVSCTCKLKQRGPLQTSPTMQRRASRLSPSSTNSFTSMTMLEQWRLTATLLIFVRQSQPHRAAQIGRGRWSSMPTHSLSPLTWLCRSHSS